MTTSGLVLSCSNPRGSGLLREHLQTLPATLLMTRVALLLPPSLLLRSPAYSHPRALALVGPAVWQVFHIRIWSLSSFRAGLSVKATSERPSLTSRSPSLLPHQLPSHHPALRLYDTIFFLGGGLCLLECKLHKGRRFICFVHYHIFSAQLLAYTRHSINCCCSFTKLCLTLCNPMNCSMPPFPVLHCLPESAHIHVH